MKHLILIPALLLSACTGVDQITGAVAGIATDARTIVEPVDQTYRRIVGCKNNENWSENARRCQLNDGKDQAATSTKEPARKPSCDNADTCHDHPDHDPIHNDNHTERDKYHPGLEVGLGGLTPEEKYGS